MSKPYIHIFQGPLGWYLYDVNTDSVVEISEKIFEILKSLDSDDKSRNNEEISALYKSGLLSTQRVETSLHPETAYLESYYARRLDYLSLHVTQSCNLNCRYCVYSNNYYTRSHSSQQMSFETAKRAIDYVFDRSVDSKQFRVGYYGGEPLLRFDLIKQCVSYINQKMRGEQAKYIITTNGTLLSEEIATFLIENNFDITVSLDGPKEVHDVDRKFRETNAGSFDVVMNNLIWIQKTAPEYYRDNIMFNTVITTANGFSAVNDFFNTNEQVKDNECSCGIVSDFYRNEKIEVGSTFKKEFGFEKFKLLYSKVHGETTPYSHYLDQNYGSNIIDRLKRKKQVNLCKSGHHGGPCIPGVKRLFVSVDGTMYPCEKVIENSEITKLGDIYCGVNIERARRIMNVERSQKTDCRSCWAYRYCSMCIVGYSDVCNKPDSYAINRCDQIRAKLEEDLIEYITLIKLGVDFY